MQAKALFNQVNSEAESLKEMWATTLNLTGRTELASPEDLALYEQLKQKVDV